MDNAAIDIVCSLQEALAQSGKVRYDLNIG